MRGSTAGLSVGTVTSLTAEDTPLLRWADILFSCLVISPLSIAYWNSTWSLMELYVFPEDPITNAATCSIFGVCFSVFLSLFQSHLTKHISKDGGSVRYYLLSRLYSEVAGISCIGAMKGVWDLFNIYDQEEVWSVTWTTLAAIVALAALRVLKNICAIPFVVVIDSPKGYFDVPTFFKTSSRETLLFILDCIFSMVVVGALVVLVWRGLWSLADTCFHTEDPLTSLLISLVLGYTLTIVTFALQPAMEWVGSKLKGAPQLLLADLYNLVSFVGTINVWRAWWMVMDNYFYPDSRYISNWCVHFISFAALILLNCFSTVLVRGVYFDNELGDECMVFPCHYIRIYYHRRRMRKKFRSAISNAEKNKLEDSNVPLQIDVQKS